MNRSQAEIWQSEADFFDRFAARAFTTVGPIDPLIHQRYVTASPRKRFNKEFRFRLVQDLKGKQVLDLGCGDGTNSVLMAKRGASVVAVDVSPKTIAVAKERARLNGVEAQIAFHCSPIELFEIPESSIDVIWADGILHHVIPQLELVLARLIYWSKPGALALFSEPICLNQILRRWRKRIPIHTDATPDERPLRKVELDLIRAYFPGLKIRHFHFLGFFDHFLLVQNNYEQAPPLRKWMCDFLHWADYVLLSAPGVRRLGSMAVMHANVTKGFLAPIGEESVSDYGAGGLRPLLS